MSEIANIRVIGAVPVTVKCPSCNADVNVPTPTTYGLSGRVSISDMTCTCTQAINVLVRI